MNIGIAHVAVYASDLEATKDFYVKYFNGKCGERYENQDGFSSYFVSFGDTVRLEVMHSLHLKRQQIDEYASGWSHVAFSVGIKKPSCRLRKRSQAPGMRYTARQGKPGMDILKAAWPIRTEIGSRLQYNPPQIDF